eukprot:g938.t1
MGGFESMDYDPVDNDVEQESNIRRNQSDYVHGEIWKWGISAAIGLVMGIVAFLVDWGIEKLNDFKFEHVDDVIDSDGGFAAPYFTFLGIALALGLVAGSLVSYVEPLAAGSGIPELKTYLNGVHIRGLLQVKTFVAKVIGVMFSISSGLIAGKEGPFVHGGGIVGGGLGGMGSRTLTTLFRNKLTFKTKRRIGGYFRNDADHRDFTAIGTAAGVATAFAAPIGGLLFTIEEGASFYSTSVLWRGFLSTSVGVVTLHFLVELQDAPHNAVYSARFGHQRDFGLYSDNDANYGSSYYYYIWEMPIFMTMAVICGLLGASFIWMNVKMTSWRHRYIPVSSAWKRTLEVMFVVFTTATISFILCYVSPCRHLPNKDELTQLLMDQDVLTRFYGGGNQIKYFPKLYCEEGEYSVYGQIFFAPLSQALRLVIHLGEALPGNLEMYQLDIGLLFILFFYTYCLMILTYGIGAATGLFVPSLMVGATFGRLVGRLVHQFLRAVGSTTRVSLASYAVVGAAASLGGATRMTISICVLVMETTGSLQLIVPIMVAVMVAKAVGDSFGLGIYDTHIEIRGAPLLEEPNFNYTQKMVHDKLKVEELMTKDLVCLPPVVKLADLTHVLRSTTHGAFPVSNEAKTGLINSDPFSLQGLVTRIQLLRMIQRRIGILNINECFGRDPLATDPSLLIPDTQEERLELLQRLEQVPLKIRAKADQEPILNSLTESDLEDCYMDLRPFMQRHPFCIHSTSNLTRAYHLFRAMGLRHLFVIPAEPKIVGLLTRKDVIKDNAQLALGEKVNRGLFPAGDEVHMGKLPFLPYDALLGKGTAPEGVSEPLLESRASLPTWSTPTMQNLIRRATVDGGTTSFEFPPVV